MKRGVGSVQFFTRKVTVKNFQNHLLASLIICVWLETDKQYFHGLFSRDVSRLYFTDSVRNI